MFGRTPAGPLRTQRFLTVYLSTPIFRQPLAGIISVVKDYTDEKWKTKNVGSSNTGWSAADLMVPGNLSFDSHISSAG